MQILFENGLEHGNFEGVGALKGTVEKINSPVLPHMGWNTVSAHSDSILFKGVADQSFYFVHSYAVKGVVPALASTTFYGEEFISAVEDQSFSATQFHPEKSGDAGLALIRNWVTSL